MDSNIQIQGQGTTKISDFQLRDKEQQNGQILRFYRQKDIDFTENFPQKRQNFKKNRFLTETYEIKKHVSLFFDGEIELQKTKKLNDFDRIL